MTDEQKLKYDNRDNVSNAVKTMDLYVGQGMTPELAYQKTMADYTRTLFPDAQFVEKYRKEYEFAKAQTLNSGFGGKETKRIKQAKELYEIASKQKEVYELINAELKNHVESIKQQSEAAKKAKEESEAAANATKEKAAAEEAARLAKEKASRPDGSIADVEYQISQKKKEISVAISDGDRIRLSTELDELVQKKRYMDLAIKYSQPAFDTKQIADMANAKSTFSNMAKLPDGWNKINPISNQSVKNVENMENSLESVSSILGSLGGLIGNASDNMGAWALSSAANIAQMIVQLQALATAQGVASAFSAPWPASLAAVATVLATISSIYSSLPKFETGGIVGGSSYFGDKLLARVNSGELILNQQQQAKLYHMTENDRGGMTISFDRVRGSDIYLALKNYMKDTGKKL